MSWKQTQRAMYNANPVSVNPVVARLIQQEQQREKKLQQCQSAAISINHGWDMAAISLGVDRPRGRKLGSRLTQYGTRVKGP